MTKRKHKGLTAKKAGQILEEGQAKGQPLTAKQKRFMGWVHGGRKPRSKGTKALGSRSRGKRYFSA